jgi:hypothetical protein
MHNIRSELTTRHDILGERHCSLVPRPLGPWSFRGPPLALQPKLFVMLCSTLGICCTMPGVARNLNAMVALPVSHTTQDFREAPESRTDV